MKTFLEFKSMKAAKGKNKKPKGSGNNQNDHEELEVNRNVGSDDEIKESVGNDKIKSSNDIWRVINQVKSHMNGVVVPTSQKHWKSFEKNILVDSANNKVKITSTKYDHEKNQLTIKWKKSK